MQVLGYLSTLSLAFGYRVWGDIMGNGVESRRRVNDEIDQAFWSGKITANQRYILYASQAHGARPEVITEALHRARANTERVKVFTIAIITSIGLTGALAVGWYVVGPILWR